jgi:ech hydrogenase subunit B
MIEIILITLAPLLGGLIYGLERVIKARMQNRQGPPLLQPFYDMFKFFLKESFFVNRVHIVLGFAHFITLWIVVGYIIIGGSLLYAIFLHLLSSIFIILAGFSVRSVYSHIGANRELLSMIAYEPIFIFMAVAFYLQNGSFEINTIRTHPSQIFDLGLIFIAFLMTIPLKLKKSPFDAHEAHQEIVGGVEIEYSGVFYEIIYTAKWLEYIFVYLLLILFAGDNLLLALLLSVSVFIVINLVDNATARIKIASMIKINLIFGLGLSLLNLFIL